VPPPAVQFALEKLTGILLSRDENDTASITFIADSTLVSYRRMIRVQLEASFPDRRLYSFHIDFEGSRNWLDEDEFLTEAKRCFDYWTGKLDVATCKISINEASAELLEQDRQSALDAEAKAAAETEDQAPILALKDQMLNEVRSGATFNKNHKEGSNTLMFTGSRFIRRDEGEDPGTEVYKTGEAFITAVRNFYDWESRRDIYPHRPPELDVWRYIITQLRR